MGTTSLTREQVNEAINEFADKIMEALGATVTDEAETEPELAGTYFKVIDIDDRERIVDATDISCGTLVKRGAFEYFRCGVDEHDNSYPWMHYGGRQLTHEEFAAEMRATPYIPRVVHWG